MQLNKGTLVKRMKFPGNLPKNKFRLLKIIFVALLIGFFVNSFLANKDFVERLPPNDEEGLENLDRLPPPTKEWRKPQGRPTRLVVSISTFPSRMFFLPRVLDSFILDQNRQPDKVYIWVSTSVKRIGIIWDKESKRKAEEASEILLSRYGGTADAILYSGNLTLKDGPLHMRTTLDYGPATKLLPTLLEETDPDTIIVTLDDDMVYYDTTLEVLENNSERHQNYANAFACEEFPNGIRSWRPKATTGDCSGFLDGFLSAAYRRSFFQLPAAAPAKEYAIADLKVAQDWEKQVFKSEFYSPGGHLTKEERVSIYSDPVFYPRAKGVPKACSIHDDVWISGNLYNRGVFVYVVDEAHELPSGKRHLQRTNWSIHTQVWTNPKGQKEQWECICYFEQFKRKSTFALLSTFSVFF